MVLSCCVALDCPTECTSVPDVTSVPRECQGTPVPREFTGMSRIKTDSCPDYMNMAIPHVFVIAKGRFK